MPATLKHVICFLLMGVLYCTVFHSIPYFKSKLIRNLKKKVVANRPVPFMEETFIVAPGAHGLT